MKIQKNKLKIYIASFVGLLILIFVTSFFIRRASIQKITSVETLSKSEEELKNELIQNYRDTKLKSNGLKHTQNLPYEHIKANLDINAESAILINVATGDILYEKNPDTLIPPASMTKIFLMYTVFQKVNEGKISFDDVVPLPPECWASHMPPRSSLMFLGKDQIVTLGELMTGLSVCSGNDASHAIAFYLFGSIEKFIEEVNRQIKLLGLKKTVIVEPSGYSDKNVTTAREMADFARVYLLKYPESLQMFHSVKQIAYPQKKNIAEADKGKRSQVFNGVFPDSIWSTIVQGNTNKLLDKLEGCDGLKTGYIKQSGYNLSLTTERNGQRYLSVTMKGPGRNVFIGNELRQKDGITLHEFAYKVFTETCDIDHKEIIVPVLGAKKNGVKLLVPCSLKTSVPKIQDKDGNDITKNISVKTSIPKILFGNIEQGKEYGKIQIYMGDFLVREESLIADRSLEKSCFLKSFFDKLIYFTIKK